MINDQEYLFSNLKKREEILLAGMFSIATDMTGGSIEFKTGTVTTEIITWITSSYIN